MKIKGFILAFLFLLFHLKGFNQEHDPIVNRLNQQFDTIYYVDIDAAESISLEAVQKAKQTKAPIDLGNAYYRRGIYYDIVGVQDSALYYLLNGVKQLKKTKDWKNLTSAYNNLAVLYFNIFDYEKVIEVSQKELAIYEEQNFPASDKAYAYNNMALALKYLKRPDESLQATEKALELFIETKDTVGIQSALMNIGTHYFNQKEYDRSMEYYKEAEQLLPSIKNNYNIMTFHNSIAQVYLKKENYPKSLEHLETALELTETFDSPEREQYLYESLSDINEKLGNYQNALEYFKKFKEIHDELYSDERNEKLAEYERKFELVELREKETANQRKIEEQKEFIFMTFIGIAVLLIFLILAIYAYRLKQKSNYLAKKRLEEKNMLVREIHHRVKNNLQLVGSMINIQSKNMTEADQYKMEQLQNNIGAMALIHESLYAADDWEWVGLQTFLETLRQQMQAGISDQIKVHVDASPVLLNLDAAVSLGLIINELFTNSVKHAFEKVGEVKIKVGLENNELVLDYLDNGKGLPQGYSLQSGNFGSRIIHAMVRKLKGEVTTQSDGGAHFQFVFKRIQFRKHKPQ